MQKMINAIQHYAWGSHDALSNLYDIANPDDQPMAELWMGAHPLNSSRVQDAHGAELSLRDQIAADPRAQLGDAVAHRFGELPFLFKVLCAAQPLSIQVHPNKRAAEAGFAREEAAGIARNAPNRNYKDANHKPELVYALTPFAAMNGFREFDRIAALLQPLADAHPDIAGFIAHPTTDTLRTLFANLLNMQGEEKAHALRRLREEMAHQQGAVWDTLHTIIPIYPDDSGLFSPLLLNVIELAPGQAMFLDAETPHAYLHGVGLEVMANSDNVLRAGLTPKYIDVAELLENVRFVAKPLETLLTAPSTAGAETRFPVPVADFSFAVHTLSAQPQPLHQESAAVLFCIRGEARLQQGAQTLILHAGESCYLSAADRQVSVTGHGELARVFNQLD
ncbi:MULTISPECIES: mannose-6-phosphate isomerase [Edwardsiella]|uniref:Mannose-6-phosphate isomerase n=2 Tax=Edwardsiella anguillarum TaxID=1821960 RepID=A0A076LQB2_9GAMM|nr:MULTISPECIES: mannose-6-phosphate isomerase [Edwardsiella]AIJ10166.1 Mannose-6-phosphate isomerase [Edwardsiella anguillarum ET080813]AKR77742.1 mannose-6-phosphate isomerase [Edwardsiella sp. LADL05-105]KAB0592152.1 mannose-6-phosphate isomerase [Edwardsiella anguillarum]UOU77409.1 mannose-6-phosphate isomerase [Edwardsiella anguillarum]WHP85603.1 mannose-6-phosphate isomerase [Edwardsiella anguillarum]